MLWKQKNTTLKTSYYRVFLILIVILVFIVLFVALSVMNVQFRRQAIENIERAQDVYVKMDINRSGEEIRKELWYQNATKNPNTVELGAYQNQKINDLYSGGMRTCLFLYLL
jgi:cell division protein YceG involved in septum cleavage